MDKKTRQLLAYLCQNYTPVTITSLMKLSYLIDLVSVIKIHKQITDFEYRRYKYGPFDKKIYDYINSLIKDGIIQEQSQLTSFGEEYIIYKYDDQAEQADIKKLVNDEIILVNEVLESLKGLGAKALTEIAYKTKPMESLGAKPDNEIGLNQVLNLKV